MFLEFLQMFEAMRCATPKKYGEPDWSWLTPHVKTDPENVHEQKSNYLEITPTKDGQPDWSWLSTESAGKRNKGKDL